VNRIGFEIDIGPTQPSGLAEAEPRFREQQERVIVRWPRGGEDLLNLSVIKIRLWG